MFVCVCVRAVHSPPVQFVAEQTSDFHGISDVNQAAALDDSDGCKKGQK